MAASKLSVVGAPPERLNVVALAGAGPRGLPLDEVGIGTAMHFKQHGIADHNGERAWITSTGAAHARRHVWA